MSTYDITPVVLTYNEEPNLRRCLEALGWAKRIVVLDSGSTDATLTLCGEFPLVEVFHRPFDNHTNQWNYGTDLAHTPWVLSLDADYRVPPQMVREFVELTPPEETAAYLIPFRYCIFGRPLRGSLYPPRAALFRKDVCRYQADGHTQLLEFPGQAVLLRNRIDHDDRKPLGRWLASQQKYAALEAEKLLGHRPENAGWPDRLRLMIWPAAPVTFIYTLLVKGLIFEGWHGWFYVLQRTYAELLLSLELLSCRLESGKDTNKK